MNMKHQTLDLLRSGVFICANSHPDAFCFLVDEVNQQWINQAFEPFRRRLAHTEGGGSYYLTFMDVNAPEARESIRKNFEDYRDELDPMVSFLTLLAQSNEKIGVLTTGQQFSLSTLLGPIEQAPIHVERLDRLVSRGLFKTSRTGTADRLQSVLGTMVKLGFLHKPGRDNLVYTVTGKMDHFHQCMRFIMDNEQVPIDESEEEQQEMSL